MSKSQNNGKNEKSFDSKPPDCELVPVNSSDQTDADQLENKEETLGFIGTDEGDSIRTPRKLRRRWLPIISFTSFAVVQCVLLIGMIWLLLAHYNDSSKKPELKSELSDAVSQSVGQKLPDRDFFESIDKSNKALKQQLELLDEKLADAKQEVGKASSQVIKEVQALGSRNDQALINAKAGFTQEVQNLSVLSDLKELKQAVDQSCKMMVNSHGSENVIVLVGHYNTFDGRFVIKDIQKAYENISFRDICPNHCIGVFLASALVAEPLYKLQSVSLPAKMVEFLGSNPDPSVSYDLKDKLFKLHDSMKQANKDYRLVLIMGDDSKPPEFQDDQNALLPGIRVDAILFRNTAKLGAKSNILEWQDFCDKRNGIAVLQHYRDSKQENISLQTPDQFRLALSLLWAPQKGR